MRRLANTVDVPYVSKSAMARKNSNDRNEVMRFAIPGNQVVPTFVMEFAKRAPAFAALERHFVKSSVSEPDFGALPTAIYAMLEVVRDCQCLTQE